MAIALVANTIKQSAASNGITTDAINTTGATLLVLGITAGPMATPTDSKGNTWAAGVKKTVTGSPNFDTQIWYCENPTVGTGHTFTESGTGTFPVVAVLAFSGTLTSGAYDSNNGTSGTTSPQSTGNIVPSEANEVLCFFGGDGVTLASCDTGTTSNAAANSGNAAGMCAAYQIQTTATTRSATFTWASAVRVEVVGASFKSAAGAASVVPQIRLHQAQQRN